MTTTVKRQGTTITTAASPWTSEDRALMLAWREYDDTLCPSCGHPKATAWHPDNEGWFEAQDPVVCHACTAAQPPGEDGRRTPSEFPVVVDTRDYTTDPLPPMPTTTT